MRFLLRQHLSTYKEKFAPQKVKSGQFLSNYINEMEFVISFFSLSAPSIVLPALARQGSTMYSLASISFVQQSNLSKLSKEPISGS